MIMNGKHVLIKGMKKIMDSRRRSFRRTAAAAALVCIGTVMCPEIALASGERVYFGSESYEWELGQSWLLGTYASADGDLESADYIITYDPEMLQWDAGGDLIEDGQVQISSDEIEGAEFRLMMNFSPLLAGETEITITQAHVTEDGESEVSPEDVSVPVSVLVPSGCLLDGIYINGIPLDDFDSETMNYTVELDEYAEYVNVSVFPEDANVEISDTTLTEGENEISVIVENEDGDKARYLLQIVNPEEVAETAAEAETQPESDADLVPEEQETELSLQDRLWGYAIYAKNVAYAHWKFCLAVGALILLFIILSIVRFRIYRKRKRAKEERQRRIRERRVQEKRERWEEEHGIRSAGSGTNDSEKTKTSDADQSESAGGNQPDGEPSGTKEQEAEIEIVVDNVCMDFKREKDESSSIKELVIRTLKRQRSVEKFRALDHVSFTVHKGEVVGIIGTNGSGKSTILKIISGALSPTDGSVTVDRSKIQLLTLGTGFDMELTGHENVYLNGAIIGYTKEYIDEKYNDIVKFAGLEGFMEERVKNYSSGMVSRLGFAIATARDTPEILILDEVLSVGDMFFRKKSEARIREMIHGGSTVLIVSHSTSVIRKNCDKVVWIEKGKLRAVGDPKEVCEAYEKMES